MSRPLRADAPGVTICARFSPAEKARVQAAAAVNHQSLSDFERDAVLERADQLLPARHS